MTYLVELALKDRLIISGGEEEILAAVREYVIEHGIQIEADRLHEERDEDVSTDDDYLPIVWHPYQETHHGPN
jgi:hypothetical protein